jgi:hypothetical protein
MPTPQDSRSQPIEVEATVLSPDGKGKAPIGKDAENASEISRIIAKWMDEVFHIPGTNIRIGLDPIIGLFPGIGDLLASSMGVVVLTEGVRTRVPVSVLIRMGLNVLINDAVGTIPVIGDLFSVWFKSNSRNLALINRWKAGERTAVQRGSRIFLVIFSAVWISLLLLWVFIWVNVLRFIFGGLGNVFGS